jgi:hypothetical protein
LQPTKNTKELTAITEPLTLGAITLTPVGVTVGNPVEFPAVPALLLGRGDVGLRLLDELDEVRDGVHRLFGIGFIGEINHEQSLTWFITCVKPDPILALEDFLHVQ